MATQTTSPKQNDQSRITVKSVTQKSVAPKKSASKVQSVTKTAKSQLSQKKVVTAILRERVIPLPGTFPFLKDPAKLKGPAYFYPARIPVSYNHTYLCAMVRDPGVIYAYWEISNVDLKTIRNSIGHESFTGSRTVIRVFVIPEITGDMFPARQFYDVDIDADATTAYIKIEPGHTYLLEIGIFTRDSRFFGIIKSNTVIAPHPWVSSVRDEQWQMVQSDELIKGSLDAFGGGLGGSSNMVGTGVSPADKQTENSLSYSSPMSWMSSSGNG